MKDRLEVLRELLKAGSLSTQDELRRKLEKLRFPVTQSTISRDLRKIGAVRGVDEGGNTVYRLPEASVAPELVSTTGIIRAVQSNGVLVVIHTTPGAAQMVARQLDIRRSSEVLGTIAGDDCVFVALATHRSREAGVQSVRDLLGELS
jgi:transcriptional regulator of arginine metabolism